MQWVTCVGGDIATRVSRSPPCWSSDQQTLILPEGRTDRLSVVAGLALLYKYVHLVIVWKYQNTPVPVTTVTTLTTLTPVNSR